MNIIASNYAAYTNTIISTIGKNVTHERYIAATYDHTKAYQSPTTMATKSVSETIKVLWGQLSDTFNIMLQGTFDSNTAVITCTSTTNIATDDVIIDDTNIKYRVESVRDINLSGTKISIEASLRKFGV